MLSQKICSLITVIVSCLLASISAAADSIALEKIAAIHNFPKPILSQTEAILKDPLTMVVFSNDSRKLLFNGTLIWMNCPATKNKDKWNISKIDYETIVGALLKPENILADKKPWIIVLDPGHGGKSIGAIGDRKVFEKKAVLDITMKTKELLSNAGISVRMTRTGDTTMDLSERTEKAVKFGADLFVSIHLNFAGNKAATGVETYVLSCQGFPSTVAGKPENQSNPGNVYDKSNTILAYHVHRGILGSTSAEDRGIKHARFNVIRDASCPAILIECGFLSNAAEEAKIIDSEYRQKIAMGISNGILEYIKKASK